MRRQSHCGFGSSDSENAIGIVHTEGASGGRFEFLQLLNFWKVVTALLRRYGLPPQGQLRLESDIPRGKGLASSTADLIASCRAVARYHRLPLDPDVLETILRDIEPSDGLGGRGQKKQGK